jgi:hypothetical protein
MSTLNSLLTFGTGNIKCLLNRFLSFQGKIIKVYCHGIFSLLIVVRSSLLVTRSSFFPACLLTHSVRQGSSFFVLPCLPADAFSQAGFSGFRSSRLRN